LRVIVDGLIALAERYAGTLAAGCLRDVAASLLDADLALERAQVSSGTESPPTAT
jgi:hypothetical protein